MSVCLLHEYVDDPDCPLCDYGDMLAEIETIEVATAPLEISLPYAA